MLLKVTERRDRIDQLVTLKSVGGKERGSSWSPAARCASLIRPACTKLPRGQKIGESMGKSIDQFMLEIDIATIKLDQFRHQLRVAHEHGLLVAALQDAGIAHLYPLTHENPDQRSAIEPMSGDCHAV
jgi:hypothetical protein